MPCPNGLFILSCSIILQLLPPCRNITLQLTCNIFCLLFFVDFHILKEFVNFTEPINKILSIETSINIRNVWFYLIICKAMIHCDYAFWTCHRFFSVALPTDIHQNLWFTHFSDSFVTIVLITRRSSQDVLGKHHCAIPINIVIHKLALGNSLGMDPVKYFPTICVNRACPSYFDEWHRARQILGLIPLDGTQYTWKLDIVLVDEIGCQIHEKDKTLSPQGREIMNIIDQKLFCS